MRWRRPQLIIADADGGRDATSEASSAPLRLLAPLNALPPAERPEAAPALEVAARPLTIVGDDAADEAAEPALQSDESDDGETWLAESEPPTDAESAEDAEPLRDDAVAADRRESPARRLPVATTQLPPLSQTQLALRDKVRKVLKHYYQRPLNTRDRSPWEIMHWLLAYEVHSQVLQGGPDGKPITTVGWLCFNQECKGRSLFYLNNDGKLRVRVGPALQGHHGQMLAMLAQARVKSDYPIRVEGREFTIEDLIAEEKLTCYPRTELTFKLIGLQQYLDIEETWINDQGMTWDFPTLIREEMRQPVRTAACGGTHRLSGLSLAVKKRERSGLPVDGEYAKAKQFVANYQNYAYRLQNSDGSLSTEWFRGPGSDADLDRRLKTTGHTLEWLVYSANDKQLQYHRTVRAVNYLCNLLWANRTRDWEAGPLGHAIHALVLYDRLAFAPYDQAPQGPVAGRAAQRR
jgi:hypothetical protein